MELKQLPAEKPVYFVGIGGISMSSLAELLLRRGYCVVGYDRQESELTRHLEQRGAKIYYTTDISHLDGIGCAVFSAAFGETHPEIVNIRARNIALYSRAELLGAVAAEHKMSVGVAGTHGKSSTTALIYSVFAAGENASPTVLNGAVISDFGSQYRIGSDDTIVFECCEYKDSFLSFYPKIAVVLNIRLDHTDYYHSIEQMVGSFSRFISHTGSDGFAVVNFDSPYAMQAAEGYRGKLITFSPSGDRNAYCRLVSASFKKGCANDVVVEVGGRIISGISLSVPGEHNLANALAAVCCADICGIPDAQLVKGLAAYTGIKRRFEYKGKFAGADVYDDYAHHPDEIKATLAAAKKIGAKRIVTVFQPHTYSRLHDLFDSFLTAFGDSDLTVFAETYSAREENIYGISPAELCNGVKNSYYFPTFEKITGFLQNNLRQGDLLLIMGAGDIEKLCEIAKKE